MKLETARKWFATSRDKVVAFLSRTKPAAPPASVKAGGKPWRRRRCRRLPPKLKPTLDADDFTHVKKIGEGSFGQVFRAQFAPARWEVVVKCVTASTPCSQAKASSEIRKLQAAKSAFVVRYMGHMRIHYKIGIVMEYLENGSLFDHHFWHTDRFPAQISEMALRYTVSCVVSALDTVHSRGLAHLDLKPENVALDKHGVPKLIDFGLCRAASPGANSGKEYIGSPGWTIPPEMIKAGDYGQSSDHFALGVLTYFLHTNRSPFIAVTGTLDLDEAATNHNVLACDHLVLPSGGFSPAAGDFVQQLMRAQPKVRLGYCGGMAEIMDYEWLEGVDWANLRWETSPLMHYLTLEKSSKKYKYLA